MKTKKDLRKEVKELVQFTQELQQTVESLKRDLGLSCLANTTLKAEAAQAKRLQVEYKRICEENSSRIEEIRANRLGLKEGLTLALQIFAAARNGDDKKHTRGIPVAGGDMDEMTMMGMMEL
mgnify:CR=1 FL=1